MRERMRERLSGWERQRASIAGSRSSSGRANRSIIQRSTWSSSEPSIVSAACASSRGSGLMEAMIGGPGDPPR